MCHYPSVPFTYLKVMEGLYILSNFKGDYFGRWHPTYIHDQVLPTRSEKLLVTLHPFFPFFPNVHRFNLLILPGMILISRSPAVTFTVLYKLFQKFR